MALSSLGCRSSSRLQSAAGHGIDIVMTSGNSGLTVHEVARAQGYFEQFNVVPNVLQVSDGGKCVAALLSGSAKICIKSGFNQLLPAIEKGAKIKILAGALNLPSLAVYSGNPNVRSVKDLEGKSIGVGSLGSVVQMMTVLLLQKKGVNVDKVTFRNVGSNADIFKAVVAKTVDAGLSDVEVFDEQDKYGVHALPDGLLWKEIPEYTNQGSYATDSTIQQDRDILVRLLAAYAKAYRFVSSSASKDIFIKAHEKVTGTNVIQEGLTQWNWIQANQPYAVNLVLSDERINMVQKVNLEFKNQTQILPFNSVADMSLAQDALKLLDKS
jgi:ABC-type nitrate/sulfonate/bicarbonate transport system substrate-binding protein